MSVYLLKKKTPFIFGAGSPKGRVGLTALQLPRKVFKFMFSHTLSDYLISYFFFHSSSHPQFPSLSLSLSDAVQSTLSQSVQWTRAQTVDWDISCSLERWSGWRRKGKRERLKCTTLSQSVQWTRRQVCTGLLSEHKKRQKEDWARETVCDSRSAFLPNSFNRWYRNSVLLSPEPEFIFFKSHLFFLNPSLFFIWLCYLPSLWTEIANLLQTTSSTPLTISTKVLQSPSFKKHAIQQNISLSFKKTEILGWVKSLMFGTLRLDELDLTCLNPGMQHIMEARVVYTVSWLNTIKSYTRGQTGTS